MKSLLFSFFLLMALPLCADTKLHKVEKVLRIKVSSSINPATLNYVEEAMEKVRTGKFDLLLMEMNTPGGLVSTTKDILTRFGESDVPVVVWITPEGASATSAGAIIASGAHVLVMSGGTNIGAATPIQMDGDIGKKKKFGPLPVPIKGVPQTPPPKEEPKGSDMRKKAINDLVALVQSLAEERGRDPKNFALMISEAKSYKAREAKKKKLVDDIVSTRAQLFEHLNGREVTVKGEPLKIIIASGAETVFFDMDLGQKLLNILAHPALAYILFLLGAALLYFELQAPGGLIAGAIGVVCLILAGVGLQVLPLNFGALGLSSLAFVLFLLEVYVTSFGILSLTGLVALVFGSMFLFRTDDSYLEFSHSLIYAMVGAIAVFLLMILAVIGKTRRKNGMVREFNKLVGQRGEVVQILSQGYQIKVAGELWRGESESTLNMGDSCVIVAQDRDKMTVRVESLKGENNDV